MAKTRPTIAPMKNGPLRVQGLENLEGPAGPMSAQPEMALCRCGQSANKPFCDGSHGPAGFDDDKQADRVEDRRDTYGGDPLTIFANAGICAEAGFCPAGAPDKWRPKTESGGHTDDELIAMIRMCPAGSLSHAIDGVEHRDQAREPAIRIAKGGPYQVQGGVDLKETVWAEGASHEHYTLCRCGASKNKPFCDGNHKKVWPGGA